MNRELFSPPFSDEIEVPFSKGEKLLLSWDESYQAHKEINKIKNLVNFVSLSEAGV